MPRENLFYSLDGDEAVSKIRAAQLMYGIEKVIDEAEG